MPLEGFHLRVAQLLDEATCEEGFALGGGYGLQAHDLADRPSKDLDSYVNKFDPVQYATAVAVAQSEFPSGLPITNPNSAAGTSYVPTVVLATGENYADALSGAPLAAKFDGALLLTQTNSIPSNVLTELVRLNPKQVIVLGGFGAKKKLQVLFNASHSQRSSLRQ